MNQVYILDTSALLSVQQVLTFFSDTNQDFTNLFFTTSAIVFEMKDQISRLRIESMISSQALFVKDVESQSISFIDERCKDIGNYQRLSVQDRSVLSLAWQISRESDFDSVIILTDDFEIQNTAKILKLKFKSVKTKGIRYSARFQKFCVACGEKLDEDDTFCPECGSTKLVRKKFGFKKKKPSKKF